MLPRTSVTTQAVFFVIAVCIALVTIDGWRSWNARTIQLQEMTVATSNLARGMGQQANDTIKEADTVVAGIVERVQADGTSPAALARLHKILATRAHELPQLNSLFVFDEHGAWLASSQAVLHTDLNNATLEYFIYHRTHADLGPHIGVPGQSRTTGKWILPVSRRIDHADGSFGGVVLATVDLDFFLSFYDSFQIGKGGAVALVAENGTMIVRRPYTAGIVGRDMVHTELFKNYTQYSPEGTAFIKSAQDSVTRLNSFSRLPDYPLFAVAALSKQEILADWWHDTLWHSAGVFFLAALMAVFGRGLIQQIRLRARAEAEVVRARDASERLNQTLERLAMQDGLTGLANRRQFDVTLSNELSRASRNGNSLALILMDVDLFKQYNDIYGHAAGDECLRAISRVIRDLTPQRPGDLAARYGGEELVVLLPDTDLAGAATVAEKIRLAIQDLQIPHSASPIACVTLSAGVAASVPVHGSSAPLELIQTADKALYVAKETGRNRVVTSQGREAP